MSVGESVEKKVLLALLLK